MANYEETWVNPQTEHEEDVYRGFSWWTLFFGVFYYAYKGMWRWFVISGLAAIFTGGLAWLYFPFKTHQWHKEYLRREGYKPKSEIDK